MSINWNHITDPTTTAWSKHDIYYTCIYKQESENKVLNDNAGFNIYQNQFHNRAYAA